jgi:hypothetical protein
MLVWGAYLLCQKYTRYHWFCEEFRRLYNNYEKKIDVGFKCRPVHPNSDMLKLKKWFLYQIDSSVFRFLIKKKFARANYVKVLIFTRLQRQCDIPNVFH